MSAEEALSRARNTRCDVAVLDISMPGRGGIEILRELKQCMPAMRVLVLTVHDEEEYGVYCLREGADGYLTKDRPIEELLLALRTVAAGHKYVSSALAEHLAVRLEAGRTRSPQESLSRRELEVLVELAKGRTGVEIAGGLHLSTKTVATYRSRLMDKLHLRTTAQVIRYALEHHLAN